jgi:hypothetical protein
MFSVSLHTGEEMLEALTCLANYVYRVYFVLGECT